VRGTDGGERHFSVSKTAMLDTDGKAVGVLSTATDVTARREAEQALKEQIKLTRDLIEANPLPIYLKDTECRYLDINAAFVRDSGLTHEKALGRTAYDVLPSDRARQYDSQDRELLARGEGSSVIETEVVRPEGSRHFMINKSVLRRSDGTVRGLVGTVTEVTALKRVESELRASREEALQAAQAKAAFLATMSHEIRTPLNGVIGMTGLLLDTTLTREQRDYVETIRDSGDTLLSVINDILDFSKIESGRLELERQPLEPARAIEQAFDMLGESARRKRVELLYQIAVDVPAYIYGDSTCLRQVIANLVGNAVKFTDAGEVLVDVRLRPAAADGPAAVEFRVSDTGIGIPADRLHVLFQPFTQVDASTTRKYGGTGLGLAICKRLTELMGGTIAVESEPGRGSTFTFTMRCEPAPAPPGTDAARGLDALAGRRILIVDDNASNLRILEHQLARWGLQARAARGGRATLELLAREQAFDAAIVDDQMPEMDGIALTQAIRKRAPFAGLPVILLSSSAHRTGKGREPLRRAIVEAHAPVAVVRCARQRAYGKARREPDRRLPVGAGASLARRIPLKILVVDDHQVNRRIARLLLGKLGYRADEAAGGRQAVAMAGASVTTSS
jgi:PAS domain S-box-containing protein